MAEIKITAMEMISQLSDAKSWREQLGKNLRERKLLRQLLRLAIKAEEVNKTSEANSD